MRQAIGIVLHHFLEKKQQNEEVAEMQRNHSLAGIPRVVTTVRAGSPDVLDQDEQVAVSSGAKRTPTRWQSLARLTSAFLGLLALCAFIVAIAYTNENYTNVYGGGDWTDGFATVSPILSLIFDPLMVLRNIFTRRTTHHALRVSIDSIIFVLGLTSLIYAIAGSIVWYWHDPVGGTLPDGSVDCSSPLNAFSRECAPVAYHIGHLQIAGSVLLTLILTCHLGLGIMGVADWVKSRRVTSQNRLTRSFEMQDGGSPAVGGGAGGLGLANKAFDLERAGSSGAGR